MHRPLACMYVKIPGSSPVPADGSQAELYLHVSARVICIQACGCKGRQSGLDLFYAVKDVQMYCFREEEDIFCKREEQKASLQVLHVANVYVSESLSESHFFLNKQFFFSHFRSNQLQNSYHCSQLDQLHSASFQFI